MTLGRLLVLGASGHGKVVADAALEAGWSNVAFADDRWPALSNVGDWTVVGDTAALISGSIQHDAVIVAIGDCRTRLQKQELLVERGVLIATVIHPRACISSRSAIGRGVVVMAGAVVNAFADVDDAAIVNTGATIDHDCRIARGAHVAPGAHLSGAVTVGECAWVGVGAVVRQGLKIGADAIVGAGAVVVSSVAERATVVGCPAAPIQKA